MTLTLPRWLADTAERAGLTFVEAFVGFLLLADTLDAAGLQLALVAGLAAALTVARATVFDLLGRRRSPVFLVDLVERTAYTYLAVFLAAVAVNPGEVATWTLAATSSLPAALAALKAVLATRVGKPSGSLLSEHLDPTPYPWSHIG